MNRGAWHKDGIVERLGVASDGEIAKEVGVSRQAVSYTRARLGIPAKPRRVLPPEVIELLGHQPDVEIAKAFGLTRAVVRAERLARGIERYKAPCGSPAKYNAGCRCRACKRAHANQRADYIKRFPQTEAKIRNRYRDKVLDAAPHEVGKIGWYTLGCRCAGCKKAASDYRKEYAKR